MLFYLILFGAITAYGYLLCNKTKIKYRNGIFISTAFTFLCILSCIRYEVGFDYSLGGYTGEWREILQTPFSEFMNLRHEKGYVLFQYLLKSFGENYQIVYIGTSILVAILAGWFIYKYAEDKVWGFFLIYGLGMYYCSMNLIRQTIAGLIFAFAVEMAKNKKIIPYILLTILASSFHKSAILMIPFYFILQIKFTKKTFAIYSLITAGIFLTSPYILDIVTKFWYGYYVNSIYLLDGNEWFYLITPIILFTIVFIFRDKICEDDKSNNIYINCAFFNLFFYIIGARHTLVDRFTIYFEPALIIGLSILINKLRKEKSQYFKNTCAFIATAVIIINVIYLFEDGHGILPYDTIFTNEDYKIYYNSLTADQDIILQPEDI